MVLHSCLVLRSFGNELCNFRVTRSYAALWAADLDWNVGLGYSSGGYILETTMKNQPGNLKNYGNQPGIMKNHDNQPGTMKNQPGTMK